MGKMSLIVVVGFNLIFMFMGFNLSGVASHSYSNYANYYNIEQAQFVAESAANIAIGSLYQNYGYRSTTNGTFTYTLTGLQGATYSIQAIRTNPSGADIVTFYIMSQYSNMRDSNIVTCNIPQYSSFAMYSVSDVNAGTNINWITGDTCNGKLHVDNTLYISGTPRLNAPVTVGNTISGLANGDSAKVFPLGYTKGEVLGWVNDFNMVKNVTGYDSVDFAVASKTQKRDIYIQLYSDGTIDIDTGAFYGTTGATGGDQTKNGLGWYHEKTLTGRSKVAITSLGNGSVSPGLGIGVIGIMDTSAVGNIHLRGTLSGKLTIANLGHGNMYIDSSVIYTDKTKDLLGLVARDSILVTDDTLNNKGTVNVQAAVLAQTFTAQDYNSRDGNGSKSGTQGQLNLYGSLAQYTRGVVTSGGYGFLKNYTYDTRFSGTNSQGAPSFPTLPFFQITSWYDKIVWPPDSTSFWHNW